MKGPQQLDDSFAGPLPHAPIPATQTVAWGEQKPEKVSLSLD
jgi:hypothetical protein